MDLKTFINNSGLAKEDKDFWVFILEKLDEAQKRIMEDFIDGSKENLRILTENIKAKKQAFENSDEKTLEEIINNEQ